MLVCFLHHHLSDEFLLPTSVSLCSLLFLFLKLHGKLERERIINWVSRLLIFVTVTTLFDLFLILSVSYIDRLLHFLLVLVHPPLQLMILSPVQVPLACHRLQLLGPPL